MDLKDSMIAGAWWNINVVTYVVCILKIVGRWMETSDMVLRLFSSLSMYASDSDKTLFETGAWCGSNW